MTDEDPSNQAANIEQDARALLDRARATISELRADLDHVQADSDRDLRNARRAWTERDRAEARAGAYRLAHDHLAAVTRQLIDSVTVHAYGLDQANAERLLPALDIVRDALSRDLDSYLVDPDDITPDTRIDLTDAGHAVTTQERLFDGIPEQLQDLTTKWTPPSRPDWWTPDHEAAALAGIADRVASVPHVAREVPPASRAWTPLPENWGPYETVLQTRLEPMPLAVGELHDAGLVRSGDPERVVRNMVLTHLVAAAEEAQVELGAYDRRILGWLARGEESTAQVVIGLVRRAFEAGRSAQHCYDTLRSQATMERDDNIRVIMVSSQKGRFGQPDLPGGDR